jgi:hypothetical protein
VPEYAAVSSQLYSDRASVVSMCLTASFPNSSGVVKGLGVWPGVSTAVHGTSNAKPLTKFLHASLCGSGMLASTLLISPGPNPVTVRLCLGRVKCCGPTGPLRSDSGALVEGRLSRGFRAVSVAIFKMSMAEKRALLRECRCERGDGGVEGQEMVGGGGEQWTKRARGAAWGGRGFIKQTRVGAVGVKACGGVVYWTAGQLEVDPGRKRDLMGTGGWPGRQIGRAKQQLMNVVELDMQL